MQIFLRFEFLPSALMPIQDFCNIMPRGLVNIYWPFKGPYCYNFQDQAVQMGTSPA